MTEEDLDTNFDILNLADRQLARRLYTASNLDHAQRLLTVKNNVAQMDYGERLRVIRHEERMLSKDMRVEKKALLRRLDEFSEKLRRSGNKSTRSFPPLQANRHQQWIRSLQEDERPHQTTRLPQVKMSSKRDLKMTGVKIRGAKNAAEEKYPEDMYRKTTTTAKPKNQPMDLHATRTNPVRSVNSFTSQTRRDSTNSKSSLPDISRQVTSRHPQLRRGSVVVSQDRAQSFPDLLGDSEGSLSQSKRSFSDLLNVQKLPPLEKPGGDQSVRLEGMVGYTNRLMKKISNVLYTSREEGEEERPGRRPLHLPPVGPGTELVRAHKARKLHVWLGVDSAYDLFLMRQQHLHGGSYRCLEGEETEQENSDDELLSDNDAYSSDTLSEEIQKVCGVEEDEKGHNGNDPVTYGSDDVDGTREPQTERVVQGQLHVGNEQEKETAD
ncbi:Hypp2740 [Branchiostoma lanceolatum]|uniref:Hypp2740 protein n=1 Tax=Branchiostoma lanceolatum TaxID=7740 RepID=A0A8J9ZWS3_BRALA|nr:Hypp2740 [Branchiostoma lanceolatum]